MNDNKNVIEGFTMWDIISYFLKRMYCCQNPILTEEEAIKELKKCYEKAETWSSESGIWEKI
jgi:hypothetical protein